MTPPRSPSKTKSSAKRKKQALPTIEPDTTPAEALVIAIALEAGAVRQYSQLAREAEQPLAKAKFRALASEERYHQQYLRALLRELGGKPKGVAVPRISEVSASVSACASHVEAVENARDAERHAGVFYRAASEKCRNPKTRESFEKLAQDEARHEADLDHQLRIIRGEAYWGSLEGHPRIEDHFWSS